MNRLSEFEQQRLGDGEPLLLGRLAVKHLRNEQGVDGGKRGIETVEVDDRARRQGVDAAEILGAVVDPPRLSLAGQQRQAVGPADDRPGRVKQTGAVLQQRAGAVARCPSGPLRR